MAKIPKEMQEFMKGKMAWVATASPDGVPNTTPKGTVQVLDDEHIIFADLFSLKTRDNLQKNPEGRSDRHRYGNEERVSVQRRSPTSRFRPGIRPGGGRIEASADEIAQSEIRGDNDRGFDLRSIRGSQSRSTDRMTCRGSRDPDMPNRPF